MAARLLNGWLIAELPSGEWSATLEDIERKFSTEEEADSFARKNNRAKYLLDFRRELRKLGPSQKEQQI